MNSKINLIRLSPRKHILSSIKLCTGNRSSKLHGLQLQFIGQSCLKTTIFPSPPTGIEDTPVKNWKISSMNLNKMFGCGCWCARKIFRNARFQIILKRTSTKSLYNELSRDCYTNPAVNMNDPFALAQEDISVIHKDICKELITDVSVLADCSQYYFDGKGKLMRPIAVLLMGKACNIHEKNTRNLNEGQRRVAMITEMIHTASLLHDDVIDDATTRRNKPSVNQVFTQKQAILAGDFILSRSSILLAQIGNVKAVEYFSYIIDNLVKGELMQLFTKDDNDERFNHYLTKTYRKTASLIAYSCRSVALFAGSSDNTQESAYNYGKNIGIAFQLIDDALDFISTSEMLGKPAGADLSLGLATAPILFAAHEFPDLHAMIARRFKQKGDVQTAYEYVRKSNGVSETILLARKYAEDAVKNLNFLTHSIEKEGLINLARIIVDRRR